jgi:CRISPR-associated endonuclease Cas1
VAHFPEGKIGNKHQSDLSEHGKACRSNGEELANTPFRRHGNILGQRTSIFHLAGNRNASHPVNAILNYAYAVLQSQVQINAVAEGYHPTVGIMHEARDGSAAFVFDLMEPQRPVIDRKVLEFVKSHVFDPADFVIRTDGVRRLNPEMARCVVGLIASERSAPVGLRSGLRMPEPMR